MFIICLMFNIIEFSGQNLPRGTKNVMFDDCMAVCDAGK